jgi:hypothetical protein
MFFNDTMQWAWWNATPEYTETLRAYYCPILIKQRNWKKKEDSIETGTDYKHQKAFMQGLTLTEWTEYSMWKLIIKLKQVKIFTSWDITRNLGKKHHC